MAAGWTRLARAGWGRRCGAACSRNFGLGLVLALTTIAVSASGQSVSTELPDLALKKAPVEGGRQPLSAAEQKQAIDSLIAKRNALDQSQPK